MKNQKKSPLKDNPLRSPGQSLEEEIQEILDREVLKYLFYSFVPILLVFFNWLLSYELVQLPNPFLSTIIVIGGLIYNYFKILKIKKRIKALKLGRDGERAVGQTLDALRE